jgi:hypothetical protein
MLIEIGDRVINAKRVRAVRFGVESNEGKAFLMFVFSRHAAEFIYFSSIEAAKTALRQFVANFNNQE